MRKQFTIFLILIFVLGLVPINFSNAADLATKLKGRILLQVESNGEAWYVHPTELKRYYMANGAEAYNIMRSLGIGITNANLTKLQNSTVQAKKHSGKIFLQVEANGEAYYVNSDGKLYYLKDGNAAYNVMRSLGLGITNKNLETIKTNTGLSAESQPISEKKESDVDILKRQLNEQAAMIKALQEQQIQKEKEASLQPLTNKQIIDKVVPATVYIQLSGSSGSGMIIDSNGYILTNAHVVSGVNSAVIKMQDKRVFTGSVVGRDENVDLAIIKINAQNLPYVELGNSDLLTAGDEVFALGFPLGLEGDASFKNGTVSRKFVESIATYIETSTEILPGNSGGPLVNKFGFVIGINTFGLESSAGSLKFAIAINTAKQYIDLLKAGRNEVKKKTTLPAPEPVPTPTPTPAAPTPAPTPAPIPTLLPAYTETQLISKFFMTSISQLLGLPGNMSSTTIIFQRSGSYETWGNATLLFNGQLILSKDGNEIENIIDATEVYPIHSRDWVIVNGLIPNTEYTYQLIYPEAGRETTTITKTIRTKAY